MITTNVQLLLQKIKMYIFLFFCNFIFLSVYPKYKCYNSYELTNIKRMVKIPSIFW